MQLIMILNLANGKTMNRADIHHNIVLPQWTVEQTTHDTAITLLLLIRYGT